MPDERRVPAYLFGGQSGVVVFACDDPRLADDSVATQACRSLSPESLARADIKLIGPMRPEYLRDLPTGVRAVIVDGVVGSPPGDTIEIAFIDMSGRDEPVVAISTHGQTLDQVVAIAQLLRDEPVIGRFVGLGVEALDPDTEPPATPPDFVTALRDAVARTVDELDAVDSQGPSADA